MTSVPRMPLFKACSKSLEAGKGNLHTKIVTFKLSRGEFIQVEGIGLTRVHVLPKVGRMGDHTPRSFRPISLTSFLLKTLERLVYRHIRDLTLRANPLNARKSTDQALDDLKKHLAKTMEEKEIAVATFMDIEGAFNNVTTEFITNALIKKGTPRIICDCIKIKFRIGLSHHL